MIIIMNTTHALNLENTIPIGLRCIRCIYLYIYRATVQLVAQTITPLKYKMNAVAFASTTKHIKFVQWCIVILTKGCWVYYLTTSFLALQILCNSLCHLLNSFRNYVITFYVYCGNVQYILLFQWQINCNWFDGRSPRPNLHRKLFHTLNFTCHQTVHKR